MNIGFTGTSLGMTLEQKRYLEQILTDIRFNTENIIYGIHGDCLGADADFDVLCKQLNIITKVRPCTSEHLRAQCRSEIIAEPKRPMQRNRDIVADADLMLACPPNKEEIKKGSGTWATIKFTRRAEKALIIIFPDGELLRERVLLLGNNTL